MSNLKSCPDCHHKVSARATVCPSCGKPSPNGPSIGLAAGQLLVVVFGVLFTMGLIGYSLNPPNSASSHFEGLTDAAEKAAN